LRLVDELSAQDRDVIDDERLGVRVLALCVPLLPGRWSEDAARTTVWRRTSRPPKRRVGSAPVIRMGSQVLGHHLPPQLLSSGRNVFEELGPNFTLLAFDAEDGTVRAFAAAAQALNVPLKIVRDNYNDGRKAYEASLILVRPDRYTAWSATSAPADAAAILSKAVGRA